MGTLKSALGIAVSVVMLVAVNAYAGKRFNKIDRNKDGKVGPRELKLATKKTAAKRIQERRVVDKKWEAKADKNNDGKLSGKEVRHARTHQYLKKHSEVDKKWEAKADKNNDGTVDRKELITHRRDVLDKNDDGKITKKERRHAWRHRKSKVNTKVEKKYDADGNGWLSKAEAKELLKDRLRIINTHGRARVNTDIEKEYDADGDGVISRAEAKAMREGLAD